jgi:hypothetical protein
MPATFYGKWSLEVVGNVNEFKQRARIVGSIASDGVVDGTIGTQVASIDGEGWNVFLERSSDNGATWQTNVIQRVPSVTFPDGLIVTLFGDDGIVLPQDSDVSVKFVYRNPQVNPPCPFQPPFPFMLPPGQFRPPLPPRVCPCCCRYNCGCHYSKKPKSRCCC